ncbi:MAG: type II toxin-antitoxin system prevent-host-death family antitoxin [Acetobacteraceae bacterium]|nr:type II toxin-antitoxin system prevent-host-death family antitoxin [Acetobacteraceae bacterium]
MRSVNIHEAKTHLSRLVEQAARGEGFIIAKAGKPMVKVVPIDPPPPATNRLGFMQGEFTVPDDFDTMMQDEIIAMFEGDIEQFWREIEGED